MHLFRNPEFHKRSETMERTCEVNPAGENSSFIFTVYVKAIPLCHFKLAFVVLHITLSNMKGNFLISLVTANTTYTTFDVVVTQK